MAALEGVFVGMLVMSSVAFYVSMEAPSLRPSITPAREPMEGLVRDLLDGLKDIPGVEVYATQLEKFVAKGVVGNFTGFKNAVSRTLPAGTECRLFLDNGHARRQVAGPSERMARESVSVSTLWRPEWAYAFALPGLETVHTAQPLPVQAFEVSQGQLVRESGVPILATATTSAGTHDRAALTALRAAPTVSLYLRTETGGNGLTYQEGAVSWVSQNQWTSTAAGPLATPQQFTVPSGWSFLNVTARITGTVVAYTMTFTDPLGVPWPLVATSAGTFPLSIPAPAAGTWTFSGAGTITGILGNPASATAWANATKLGDVRNYTAVLRESAGQALAAGTRLNLTLPSVLDDLALTPPLQAGWTNVRYQESANGANWVSAELSAPLANAELPFVFQGTRPPGGNPLYDVSARLENSTATARATFVVGGSAGVTTSANTLEHEVYLSVPKPHAPGATATWGAVLAYPSGPAGLPETVRQLDVVAADGTALFAGVAGITPAGTWSVVSPSHLRWTGTQTLGPNQALGFLFNVTTLAGETMDEPAITVPLAFFGGTNFTAVDMDRPYVYHLNVPPPIDVLGGAQPGFQVPSGAGLTPVPAAFNITQVQRGALVTGQGGYNVSTFGTLSSIQESLRAGLARSQLTISKQGVKLEEPVNLTVDFQGLFDNLGALGATITGWNVELAVYDPAQPFEGYAAMQPSFRGRFGANGTLEVFDVTGATNPSIAPWDFLDPQGNPEQDATSRAYANVTFRPPRDAFYGPHAVVARANFAVNDGVGNSLVQSARMLGIIDVLPNSGQSGTALYWATLECWLPDW